MGLIAKTSKSLVTCTGLPAGESRCTITGIVPPATRRLLTAEHFLQADGRYRLHPARNPTGRASRFRHRDVRWCEAGSSLTPLPGQLVASSGACKSDDELRQAGEPPSERLQPLLEVFSASSERSGQVGSETMEQATHWYSLVQGRAASPMRRRPTSSAAVTWA